MSVARIACFVLAAAAANACGKGDSPPQATASMSAVVISVDGMACERCASRVHRTLAAIDGVGDADVSLEQKQVIVHFDSHKLSPERLASAIDQAGFKAGTPAVSR